LVVLRGAHSVLSTVKKRNSEVLRSLHYRTPNCQAWSEW
jgi:hypothetical protein